MMPSPHHPTSVHPPPPPTTLTQLAPSRTVVTSFSPKCQSLEDGDWVLAVAGTTTGGSGGGGGALACALSNGQVQVYDPERLHTVHTYPACFNSSTSHHDAGGTLDGITNLTYAPSPVSSDASSPLLWVAHAGGTVRIYDTRQSVAVGCAVVPARTTGGGSSGMAPPAWDVAVGYQGTVAAIASKRKIHFWEVRQQSWLGCYSDAHTDHITKVCFDPNSNNALLSGGEDGLVCLWDTTQPREEDALQSVWNVGRPIRQIGTTTTTSEPAGGAALVWCLTGSETVGLWDPATNEARDFGLETRQILGASCGMSIDYLVDCHWDTANRDLWLTAGNSRGDAAVFRAVATTTRSGSQPSSPVSSHLAMAQIGWEPTHVLSGGHRGVVRGMCHLAPHVWFTVGEDARLCEWHRWGSHHRPSSSEAGREAVPHVKRPSPSSPSCAVGGGPVRKTRTRPTNTTPY